MLKTVSTQLALASDTLPEVLAKGNTTGGTDLAVSAGDDITFADNSKAIFGAGSDLSIYSDGATGQVTGNVNVTGAATFGGNVQVSGNINTSLQSLSAWTANSRAVELTTYGSVSSNDNIGTAALSVNAYESSDSAWSRVAATNATRFQSTYSGEHKWSTAIGGIAGSAIVWADQMILDVSGNLSPTGNVVLANGKGIDFSATAGTGTSELLSDYEEGVWSPADNSGAALAFANLSGNCHYTKVGNLVTCIFNITYPATADGTTCSITGLPFIAKNTTAAVAGGHFTYSGSTTPMTILVGTNSSQFFFYQFGGTNVINSDFSAKSIRGVITYIV
tara:strand:+ start:1591 stop:2592 length:1002 start_codon:yes stop_codon:yes gene_type:complete